MSKQTIIPFGPQHPVLPEPIHLDLILEDETVVGAIPSIGYIHRGLEKLVEKKDYQEYMFVAERICGICSFVHGAGYCYAVESAMQLEIPDRARVLRLFWMELSRIHSHILWLGLMADAYGFESLFMHCWRMRETVLDIFDQTCGGRVIFSCNKVGGVRRNITNDDMKRLIGVLNELEPKLKVVTNVFYRDKSVQHRMVGVGVMDKATAMTLGAVGPTARGSGVGQDMRTTGYMGYDMLKFEPCVETAGDCQARTIVRVRELHQSFDLCRQAAELLYKMPDDSEISIKVPNPPDGEFTARMEQPRGEVVYYVKANGTKYLDRVRVRTPTFANIPALLHMLAGSDLADVPCLALTIDPCISCTER